MKKLIKKLQKWEIRQEFDTSLTKWQREIIYDFIIELLEIISKFSYK